MLSTFPKISVCILALNEENKIGTALESIKGIAHEIIIGIDNKTTDDSIKISRKYTNNVHVISHITAFDSMKQLVIKRAKNKWILWLDADEKLTDKLCKEIKITLNNADKDGYYIPRKNIIFGKWIRHTGWYPDYQLRLFKAGRLTFSKKYLHKQPQFSGKTGQLTHPLIHKNYDSIAHFINKLNRYTDQDAHKYIKKIRSPYFHYLISGFFEEFIKRFLVLKGFKDGFHGFLLSVLQAFYEFTAIAKAIELNKFKNTPAIISPEEVESATKTKMKDWKWWLSEIKIRNTNQAVKKMWLKGLRKLKYNKGSK